MKYILLALVTLLFAPPCSAFENIRVVIADDQRTVIIESRSKLYSDGTQYAERSKKLTFTAATLKGQLVRIRSADDFTYVNKTSYRGWVELRKKKDGRILVINDVDIEDYLKGVIPSEVPAHWELEALKAQAVASRTYALYQKRASGNRPYHILASIKSQVYNGSNGERKKAIRAVAETSGVVLTYRGEIIPSFYHASCGGHTEDAAELWGLDEPYLKGVTCECQSIVKDGLWERHVALSRVIGALGYLGYHLNSISDMSIKEITDAGRVRTVSIRDDGKTVFIPAETLRSALGNTLLPSVFYELEIIGNEAIFSGRGSGHGVGMCQWGAQEMALRGIKYQAILSHYYPGTVLIRKH